MLDLRDLGVGDDDREEGSEVTGVEAEEGVDKGSSDGAISVGDGSGEVDEGSGEEDFFLALA